MEWVFKEAVFGDMVRVALGEIFHYGIYVTDDEVIQFGLPPRSLDRKSEDISVLSTNIETFLCGKILQVAEFDRKEKKKKRSPDEIVGIARGRIGEKGYNILYNNCEHFVFECVLGEKKCTQTDSVRQFWRSMPLLEVYAAPVPFDSTFTEIYPAERALEIESCNNEKLREQKKYDWLLLEYAFKRVFGKDIRQVKIKKAENGAWYCDEYFFSLSHSETAVAVAVSKKAVGVDIETLDSGKPIEKLAERILTPLEKERFETLSEQDRQKYFLYAWSGKESRYKQSGKKDFLPQNIEGFVDVVCRKYVLNGNGFALTVCSQDYECAEFYCPFGGSIEKSDISI